MIKKFIFGSPINTEAIVNEENITVCSEKELSYFSLSPNTKDNLVFTMDVCDKAIIYGLGEANRGINKRGYVYESNCTDDPNHTEDKVSLYGAHNFLIIDPKDNYAKPFAIFLDTPYKICYDICFSYSDKIIITTSNNVSLYLIELDSHVKSNSYIELVRSFRTLIGQSYIPPKWAFGYQQCRWSYMSANEIRDVVKKHRDANIPLDAVYLDIDYMDNYKDFTINDETFADFEGFVTEMKSQNIHLVPIIDAGVKIEKGYDVYEEGVANGYFCKDDEGNDYVACVWPGYTHFPDFMQPKAREWFGNKYSILIDKGIDGFWNDMNEPSIFYTPYGISRLIEKFQAVDINKVNAFDNDTLKELFELRGEFDSLANNPADYSKMYHNVDGKMVCHSEIHNIYGYNMTKSASEAITNNYPDKRILLFSRSSYIGMHRYGGIWTGDNHSWWSHLLLSIKMMPSLNMCGFLYTGSDIGGFGCNTSQELLLRWLAFGVFTPLMRNHSAFGTRRQEFYHFDNIESFKKIIDIRYALIPYLYSEFVKAALCNNMYFRPLAFDYPDDSIASNCEDQLMVGESIMIAPVYTQNATGRYVYLPDDMMYIKFRGFENKEIMIMKKGVHFIDIAIDEIPVFVKKNHILPLAKPAKNAAEIDTDNLEKYCYMGDEPNICQNNSNIDNITKKSNIITYELYNDDGYSPCKLTNENITYITCSEEEAYK